MLARLTWPYAEAAPAQPTWLCGAVVVRRRAQAGLGCGDDDDGIDGGRRRMYAGKEEEGGVLAGFIATARREIAELVLPSFKEKAGGTEEERTATQRCWTAAAQDLDVDIATGGEGEESKFSGCYNAPARRRCGALDQFLLYHGSTPKQDGGGACGGSDGPAPPIGIVGIATPCVAPWSKANTYGCEKEDGGGGREALTARALFPPFVLTYLGIGEAAVVVVLQCCSRARSGWGYLWSKRAKDLAYPSDTGKSGNAGYPIIVASHAVDLEELVSENLVGAGDPAGDELRMSIQSPRR
uniref:Uncharacterized protein n=1 Tax=Oryza rufipogon TaxID=4529 RepID=A0A0E0Q6N1_ORYRU